MRPSYLPLIGNTIFVVVIAFWFYHLVVPLDNTDTLDGTRSGMSLHVDALTGCHYLARRGGMTPRLSADGAHICTGYEEVQ